MEVEEKIDFILDEMTKMHLSKWKIYNPQIYHTHFSTYLNGDLKKLIVISKSSLDINHNNIELTTSVQQQKVFDLYGKIYNYFVKSKQEEKEENINEIYNFLNNPQEKNSSDDNNTFSVEG